ncbi:MAG: hypothetical protein JO257_37090 [Deltaproteobacteria bacterium]|nr:hypothetical protein [Deltaproteobacteria bacterium]
MSKLAVIALLGLCAPALAQSKVRDAGKKPAKPNCGEAYVVGKKDAAPKGLVQQQVEDVLKSKVGEVETCWQKLPADQRKKDVAAVLSIEIDDDGEVQTAALAGVPDDASRCVAVAAVAWEFPRSDVKADAETFTFPIALKAK